MALDLDRFYAGLADCNHCGSVIGDCASWPCSGVKELLDEIEFQRKQNLSLSQGTQALVAQLGVAQRRGERMESAIRTARDTIKEWDGHGLDFVVNRVVAALNEAIKEA